MLMAGLDGIQSRINPGDPIDKNLYDLPPVERAKIKSTPGSLDEALDALEADHRFSAQGRRVHKGRSGSLYQLQTIARNRRNSAASTPVRVLSLLRHLIA
jgi:Glutamine synthetase, catalytic domain